MWQKKRLEIFRRDKFRCRLCKDEETSLNVHHLVYDDVENPWDYENKDLVTLCEHCHKEIETLKNKGVDFNLIKVLKISGWTDDSIIMFIYYPDNIMIRIYDKDYKYLVGYFLDNHISEIRKFLNLYYK